MEIEEARIPDHLVQRPLNPRGKIEPVPAEPTPDDPPWNGWVAFGVWAASIIFIAVIPLFFVLPYAAKQDVDFQDRSQILRLLQNDPVAVVLQLLAIIPAHVLTLALAWVVVTRFKRFSFRRTLGWEWGGFKVWYTIPIIVVFFGLAAALTAWLGSQENEMDRLLKSSRYAVYLVAFFAVFTAPRVEEVVYRGILYSAWQRRFGVILATVGVTILFAAIHIPQYSNDNTPDYAALILLLTLSLALTVIRAWSGNLLPCIVLHTVFNGIQSVLLVLEPYLPKMDGQTPDHASAVLHLLNLK